MVATSLKVPKKLLKVNETGYTDEWAKETYSFFHMFDRSIHLAAPRDGDQGSIDLSKWKSKAIELTYEIKNRGLVAGRQEMVRIVNKEYNLTVPGRNMFDNRCKDIDDIFCIVGNKDWYYQDVDYSRNVIYHLLYLISRTGYNSWLINAEKEWMEQNNVMYDTHELEFNHKSNVKGFVYTIMSSTFSNTTQKAFRKKLLYCYQEFVTVRNRKKFDESNEFFFSPYVFKKTYNGYIVTPKQPTSLSKTMPSILRAGKSWIKECKGLKMDENQIHNLVSQLYNNKTVLLSRCNSVCLTEMKDEHTKEIREADVTDIQEISVGKNCI